MEAAAALAEPPFATAMQDAYAQTMAAPETDLATDVAAMDAEALVEAMLDLEHDRESQLADAGLAQELAEHLKAHVDELAALRGANGARRPKRRKRRKREDLPEGPVPDLAEATPIEQARWIFMERYISLEKHEELLGLSFQPEEFAKYQEAFDRLVKDLLLLPRALESIAQNDIVGLQRLFASCVPLFRCPQIADAEGGTIATAVESLRRAYPSFFYKRRKKPNWFESRDFYTETVPGPRWVLCDTEYMNCTLRRPEKKLAGFARDWDLPAEYAEQKSVVEDIYDRVIVGEALGEDLFAGNYNSLTTTRYRTRKSRRLVYTVQKVHKITIHGKAGMPHWRAKRRLWPGVQPMLAFPDTP